MQVEMVTSVVNKEGNNLKFAPKIKSRKRKVEAITLVVVPDLVVVEQEEEEEELEEKESEKASGIMERMEKRNVAESLVEGLIPATTTTTHSVNEPINEPAINKVMEANQSVIPKPEPSTA